MLSTSKKMNVFNLDSSFWPSPVQLAGDFSHDETTFFLRFSKLLTQILMIPSVAVLEKL